METVEVRKEIKVFYVKAVSFPDDIMETWNKLFALLPPTSNRKLYGISHGDKDGGIVYMAAAEEVYDGEAGKLNCETFIIPAGNYISETLKEWRKDVPAISKIFRKLLTTPQIDPQGFCLEDYFNDRDVRCMVKMEDKS